MGGAATAESEVAQLKREYLELERKLAATERERAHTSERARTLEDALAKVRKEPHVATVPSTASGEAPAQWPTTSEIAQIKAKHVAATAYYPLVRSMNLSQQQADDFIALLASEQLNQAQPGAQQSAASPPTLEPQTLDEKVQAIIGYENLSAFQKYRGTMMEQVRATQIANSLASIGLPVTAQERAAIATVMISAREASPPPADLQTQDQPLAKFAAWKVDHDRRVLEGLKSSLNASQLSFVKEEFRLVDLTYQELVRQERESAASGSRSRPASVLAIPQKRPNEEGIPH